MSVVALGEKLKEESVIWKIEIMELFMMCREQRDK